MCFGEQDDTHSEAVISERGERNVCHGNKGFYGGGRLPRKVEYAVERWSGAL